MNEEARESVEVDVIIDPVENKSVEVVNDNSADEDQPEMKGSDVVEIVDDRETIQAEDSNNIDEY